MDGVFQETGEESCQSICDAVNVTIMADTISGPSDPRLDGTYTCATGVVGGQCSGIAFYVKLNNRSADILVANSPAREYTVKVQVRKGYSALCPVAIYPPVSAQCIPAVFTALDDLLHSVQIAITCKDL